MSPRNYRKNKTTLTYLSSEIKLTEEKAYILLLTQNYLVKWDVMPYKVDCYFKTSVYKCFPGGTDGKELACQGRRLKRHEFDPLVGKIPWRRA